jgi:hypothetical protein
MKPLYIFDLDGTIALIDHRRSILNGDSTDKWERFYDACDMDEPNFAVIQTMELLMKSGADVLIFSGRSDKVRTKTVAWLTRHTSFTPGQLDVFLWMRRDGDYTPDHELKEMWFRSLHVDDRCRLVACFDDRNKVVDMWRLNDLTCFQVAPGDF